MRDFVEVTLETEKHIVNLLFCDNIKFTSNSNFHNANNILDYCYNDIYVYYMDTTDFP